MRASSTYSWFHLCCIAILTSACTNGELNTFTPASNTNTAEATTEGPFADLSNDILTPLPQLQPVLSEESTAALMPFDLTGSAIAMGVNGRVVAIGAEGTDWADERDTGAIHVLFKVENQWWPDVILHADSPLAGASLGRAVALSADGNTLVAGAPGNALLTRAATGAAIVYERFGEGWQQTSVLTPQYNDEGFADLGFGTTVNMSDDGSTVVVGSYDGTLSTVGIYQRRGTQWLPVQRIEGAGHQVALAGNGQRFFVVSTGNRQVSQFDWNQGAYLQSGDSFKTDGSFAGGIDTNTMGNRLFVSHLIKSASELKKSVAAVESYQQQSNGNWEKRQTLIPPGVHSSETRISVASSSSGDDLVVGLSNRNSHDSSVSRYEVKPDSASDNLYQLRQTVSNPSPEQNQFAESVAIGSDGHAAIISAPMQSNRRGDSAGMVYHLNR